MRGTANAVKRAAGVAATVAVLVAATGCGPDTVRTGEPSGQASPRSQVQTAPVELNMALCTQPEMDVIDPDDPTFGFILEDPEQAEAQEEAIAERGRATTAQVPADDMAAIAAVLGSDPAVAAAVNQDGARVRVIYPWVTPDGTERGFDVTVLFPEPTDLPDYGHLVPVEEPVHETGEVELDENGLPVVVLDETSTGVLAGATAAWFQLDTVDQRIHHIGYVDAAGFDPCPWSG